MDPLLRPVGPAPSAIYWRRRVVVLAVLVLVSYLVVRACSPSSGPGPAERAGNGAVTPTAPSSGVETGGGPSGGGTEGTTPGESAGSAEPTGGQGTGSATPQGAVINAAGGNGGGRPGYCIDDNIRLDARPDKRSYAPAERPVFELSFFNVGDGPCRFDVGPAAWKLEVFSGQDRIWSSDDCAEDEQSSVVTLQRLTPHTVKVTWDRTRSDPGCPTGQDKAAPGTYTVTGTAGEITSPKAVFILEAPTEAG